MAVASLWHIAGSLLSCTWLSSPSRSNRLADLGDLVAGADNSPTLTILDILNVLVLSLCALPDLDFAATTNDTNSHCGKKVVSSVRMHINTTVEPEQNEYMLLPMEEGKTHIAVASFPKPDLIMAFPPGWSLMKLVTS